MINVRSFLTLALALAFLGGAQAQTASDPNGGSQLARDTATGAYTFSWWGVAGRTYFLQSSEDLINWIYLPIIESGWEDVTQWGFTSTSDKFFVRLKFTDIFTDDPYKDDFDGDHVGNYDELLQGTDPFSAALDTNGLPLDWEKFYAIPLGVNPDTLASRGDGLTVRQAFDQGLNPNDFFNGHVPVLAKSSGDNQTGSPGGYLPAPLVVSVTDADGIPLANASVTFTVSSGGGQLKASSSASLVIALVTHTDADGLAQTFFQLPNSPSATSIITVSVTGNSQATPLAFTALSNDGTGQPTISPFMPTNFIGILNSDGSTDMTWENHTDNQTPVEIEVEQPDGSYQLVVTLEPGTTYYHLPPQPQ